MYRRRGGDEFEFLFVPSTFFAKKLLLLLIQLLKKIKINEKVNELKLMKNKNVNRLKKGRN